MNELSRLLTAQRIAVIGGGAWCEAIIGAAERLGYQGEITPIHPTKPSVAGLPAKPSLSELSAAPDAAFVGVNRLATIEIVRELAVMGAGGAVCFASGFAEAEHEAEGATDLQERLVTAAGDMPILGPNCYGFLNALDRTGIWPDQHGLVPIDRGVAFLTQSSNIAINLTMQSRGLPIAMMVTCGNQAQTSQADIAAALLDDSRITALGLHIEGFGDLRAWEALAAKAHAKGIPLLAIKSGRSAQARAATVSHTASLAGADAGAEAFLARLGIARLPSLPALLEGLKIAHMFGKPGKRIASISCSGGEAALAADTAESTSLTFPPLTSRQETDLRAALGPMVALANPLDYHTYIWRDGPAMTKAWSAMADPEIDLTLVVLDYPRSDRCDPSDWSIATEAVIDAARLTGRRYAVCATLPELLPEETANTLMEAGVLPMMGLDHGLAALDLLASSRFAGADPVLLPGAARETETLFEADAKAELAASGLQVPKSIATTRSKVVAAAPALEAPFALKVLGLAHKTGQGGLALGLRSDADIKTALERLEEGPLLLEEMVDGVLVELLVGVVRDPAHGFLLTLAAGGTQTELLDDSASLLVPASRTAITDALNSLRLAPRLRGYRGSAAVDFEALPAAIEAVQTYVIVNQETLEEVEVNPLILTATSAVAVDALIRKARL